MTLNNNNFNEILEYNVKISTLFEKTSSYQFKDLTEDRKEFWLKILNLIIHSDNQESSYRQLENQIKSLHKKKAWELELNFLHEQMLTIELDIKENRLGFWRKRKYKKELEKVVQFYKKMNLYARLHASKFLFYRLAHKRSQKSKNRYILINIIENSLEKAIPLEINWINDLFLFHFGDFEIEMFYLLLDNYLEELTTSITIKKHLDSFFDKNNSKSPYKYRIVDTLIIFSIFKIDVKTILKYLIIKKQIDNQSPLNILAFFEDFSPFESTYKKLIYLLLFNNEEIVEKLTYFEQFFERLIDSLGEEQFNIDEEIIGILLEKGSLQSTKDSFTSNKKSNSHIFYFLNSRFRDKAVNPKFHQFIVELIVNFNSNSLSFKKLNEFLSFCLNFITINNISATGLETDLIFLHHIETKSSSISEMDFYNWIKFIDLNDLDYYLKNKSINNWVKQKIKQIINTKSDIKLYQLLEIVRINNFQEYIDINYIIDNLEEILIEIIPNFVPKEAKYDLIKNLEPLLAIDDKFKNFKSLLTSIFSSFQENSYDINSLSLSLCDSFKQEIGLEFVIPLTDILLKGAQSESESESEDQDPSYLDALTQYLLVLDGILINSNNLSQITISSVKQSILEVSNIFTNQFKSEILALFTNYNYLNKKSKTILIEIFKLLLNFTKEERFIFNFLLALRKIISNSENLPAFLDIKLKKYFTKLNWLAVFDLTGLYIQQNCNIDYSTQKQLVGFKLDIIRALGYISGRSHEDMELKSISLLKESQSTYSFTIEDCIEIIDDSPWYLMGLDKKFNNFNPELKPESSLGLSNDLYGEQIIFNEKHPLSLGIGYYVLKDEIYNLIGN